MIYQVQQTQSECPECSRLRHHHSNRDSKTSSSSSQYEEEQNHRIVIPISKYQGGERFSKRSKYEENAREKTSHIQKMLQNLQREVQKLKKDNQGKDKKIRKLQTELTNKEVRFYPQHARVGSIYQNQLQNRVPRSSKGKRLHTEYQDSQPISPPQYPQYPHQSRTLLQLNDIEQRIKQISDTKNQKISILQNQVKQLQQENIELNQKLDEQINDNQWLTKFCLSFVSMAGKVASIQMGKNILQPRYSLRKNTKIAWKYFKGFVKEVVQ